MLIKQAADLLRSSKYAIALTGAGISTPSGIPDFRTSNQGLWQQVDPFEVASLTAFKIRPERFYDWVRPLTEKILEAKPNPAHIAMAQLQKAGLLKEIITQNIDSLHQRAGSEIVHEVHGSLDTLTCGSCYTKYNGADFMDSFIHAHQIPTCPQCNHILKPDVILMEEQLPIQIWQAATKAAKKCDLMLVAGSSLEVVPAANLPITAMSNGAQLIIINHTPTYVDERATVIINQDVAEALPLIANELTQ